MSHFCFSQNLSQSCYVETQSSSGKPGGDLLEHPAVTIRIVKCGVRAIALVPRCGPADSIGAVGLELSSWFRDVKHLADRDTAGHELVVRILDTGNHQVSVRRTGSGR